METSEDLMKALTWLCEDKNKIMDYGCGDGFLLIDALKKNENARGFGIDISEKVIENAEKNALENDVKDRANFRCGGVEVLKTIKDNRYEAVILSNILDSMTPMDCYILLDHIKKIVKKDGKILIKVAPYKDKEELINSGAIMLNDELFEKEQDVFIRNLTTEKWLSILQDYFELNESNDGLFLMINNK
ncbi:MAG: class I SAM-dependent methyltransferase [Clostridium sp.]|nr:class I SAM-dependent methyltransferase [Clostridium sp.]